MLGQRIRFGNFDSEDIFIINDISLPLMNQSNTTAPLKTQGSRLTNATRNAQNITVKFTVVIDQDSPFESVEECRRYLNRNLSSMKEERLIIDDEPFYYSAVLDGEMRMENMWQYGTGELKFLVPDGLRHALEEKTFSADGDYITVENNGDVATECAVDIEFNSDCDFLGLTTNQTILQLGTWSEVDSEKPKSTVIFNDKLEKDVSKRWKSNIAKSAQDDTTQLIGKMGVSTMKYGQAVVDFGTPKTDGDNGSEDGKVWHGASLSRYINDSISNFFLEARVRFDDDDKTYSVFKTKDEKYTVKRSDTLNSIAKQFNIDKKYLKSWNDIKSEKNFGKKWAGKSIIVGKKDQVEKVNYKKATEMKYYYAGVNDTVKHACSVTKVSESNFRSWNKLKYNEDKLKEGHPYIIKKGSSLTAFKNGRTEFHAVDEGNNIIAGIRLKDNTEGFNKIQVSFYIGDKVVKSTELDRKYLDLYADLSIRKVGNKITFSCKAINEKTQKQFQDDKGKRVEISQTYTNEDVAMLSLKRVDYLGLVYRNVYKESRAIYQSFTHCRVTELPEEETYHETFTFKEGDKVTIENNIPYVNGVKNLNYMAIGSDNLLVSPGITDVRYTYPDDSNVKQPTVTIRMREAYL